MRVCRTQAHSHGSFRFRLAPETAAETRRLSWLVLRGYAVDARHCLLEVRTVPNGHPTALVGVTVRFEPLPAVAISRSSSDTRFPVASSLSDCSLPIGPGLGSARETAEPRASTKPVIRESLGGAGSRPNVELREVPTRSAKLAATSARGAMPSHVEARTPPRHVTERWDDSDGRPRRSGAA